MALVDLYGQIIGTDTTSKLSVFVDSFKKEEGGADPSYNSVLGGTTQFTSQNGIFTV
jgi:hypothetical protein